MPRSRTAASASSKSSLPLRGEIRLKNETVARLEHYRVSRGVPLPPGEKGIRDPGAVSIRDADGRALPSAGRVLQTRPDGTIEWLLVDFVTTLDADESKSVFVELRPSDAPPPEHPVEVRDTADEITLTNGITTLRLNKAGGSLLRGMTLHGREVVGPQDRVDLETVDAGGKIHRASLAGPWKVLVEHQNPVRATVLVEGTHKARDGATFLDFALRFTLSAGVADLKLEHTFYCREKNPGVTTVKAIRLVMPTRMPPDAKKVVRQVSHGQEWRPRPVTIAENCEVVSSSTNDLDNYPRDVKPFQEGTLFVRNLSSFHEDFGQYPYHLRPDFKIAFRAQYRVGVLRQVYPYVGWVSPELTLVPMFERWSKLHPKSINFDEGLMTISIWPEWAGPLALNQGVSKTHTIWLTGEPRALDIEAITHHGLRWEIAGLDPVSITFDPAWPIACEALEAHLLLRYQPAKYPFLENLIEPFPAAGNPDRFTYYRLPGSGMLSFGDFGGESGFTNNEDDAQVFWPLQDYLRSGRMYAFDCGQDTAKHYLEVDFCEFSTSPRQDGALIAHTQNHFEGMTYPSHEWSEGVLAYYYLTGDPRARAVVIRVAENMIWWVENLIDGIVIDGREAGMPLVNFAAAYRLTRDERYLAAAQKIIDGFARKYFDRHGALVYPYPQWGHTEGGAYHKNIHGYGDWSTYHGLYRVWEQTGDEALKALLVGLLKVALTPENFAVNDARSMDFFTVWIYLRLTGDESVFERLGSVVPMLLRRGGHPTRRLQFLKELDDRGLLDERLVGSRGGVI